MRFEIMKEKKKTFSVHSERINEEKKEKVEKKIFPDSFVP